MTAWILLPVSLSAFSITGLWTVYAMAVKNHHACPVENWSYNESCYPDPAEQGGPKTCCTLDDVPLIRQGNRLDYVSHLGHTATSVAHTPQRAASSASLATWVLSWWS